jgi:hypothetical protein
VQQDEHKEIVMFGKCLRTCSLFATLVASLHVCAETRYWILSGVEFEDGAVATGYFSYDDATRAVADWNVRVSGGAWPFLPWTFVPGNSIATGPFSVYSYTGGLHPDYWWRDFGIAPAAPLDGEHATVFIDVCRDCPRSEPPPFGFSRDAFVGYYDAGPSRKVIAGSLVLASAGAPFSIVQVDEFYHDGLRHYFITADARERQLLDTGAIPGWQRTGESFKAYAAGTPAGGSINPVCRYYGLPARGLDSHFYSADLQECVSVFVTFASDWLLESDNVFQINLPDKVTGACPGGTAPIYRLLYRPGDSNHRYATSTAVKNRMRAAGYVSEGYGPDGVAMCAVQ